MGAAPNLLMKLLTGTPESMGLALAALVLSKESDSSVDVTASMRHIVAMANEICERLPSVPATGDIIYAINTHLFDELKFACLIKDELGKGPFIHLLLNERYGEPIPFVILYLTLGRMLHLPFECVSLSGRLLLRIAGSGGEDVIDPCSGGVVLTRSELKALFEHAVGGAVEYQPRYGTYLEKMDDRAILIRLLKRYRVFLIARHQYSAALATVEAILHISPGDGVELLERARLLEKMSDTEAAAADYFRYLERNPGSPDSPNLRQRVRQLLAKREILH